MLVILLSLRNLSATAIPALALPISVIGTFAAMYALVGSWDFTLTEAYPATVLLEPTDAPDVPTLSMLGVLRRVRSAGVGLQLVDVPTGDTFNFSDDPEASGTDAGRGFSTTAGLVGGQLVGMVTT